MRTLMVAVILLGGTAGAAPRSKPTLEHGDVTVTGTADATALTKVVKRSSAKLLGCYKKALVTHPGLYGTATVTFTIGGDGKVTTADTAGLITSAGACIATTITKIRFAKTKDGQPVKVTYPLTFEPGDTATAGRLASLTGMGDLSADFDDAEPSGRSDFGPAGSGNWGVIGHGGGTGSGFGATVGRGGMRGRSGNFPRVSAGQPTSQGALDTAIIRRYVKRNIQRLSYCYEKELFDKPALQRTVTAEFTIGGDGLVSSSTAKGLGNTKVETCVAGVIKAIEFPRPKGNGAVTVKYPLTFEPAAPPATAN